MIRPISGDPRKEGTAVNESTRDTATRGWTRDARGRKVSQIDAVTMHLLRRHDRIPAEELGAIVDTVDPQARRAMKLAIWLLVPIFILTAGGLALNIVMEGGDAWRDLVSTLGNPVFVAAIFLPCIVGGVIVPFAIQRQQRRQRVLWALLRHSRCPHCAYDLRGLPADEADGATVCPECGCAWQLDLLGTAEPPIPPVGMAASGGGSSRLLVVIALGLTALAGVALFWFMLMR